MSGEVVELLFGVPVDPDEFLDVVVALGGERHPDEWNDGRLVRDSRTVWIFVDPDEEPEPDQVFLAEERLGAPIGRRVIIDCSKAEGSDRLALEVIEAAASRWPLVVDTLNGEVSLPDRIVTVDYLRSRVDAGKPYVFAEALPLPDMEGTSADDGAQNRRGR